MGKQKLDAIIGDLRYDIAVTSQWKSVGKAVQMVLTLHPQLKYLALNKTYAVPSDFKEVCLESFPRPISFSGFEEKNGVRLLNRLTLDLTKFGENVDSLMHTLTKNFLPENFDLIAVRPGSLSQLEAFLNTHNITVDIICLDGAIRVLESARPDVFKKMKAQKYYMEVLYSPYLRCEDAAERVRILRAPNLLVPISIRHCRKFLISSGASSPQHLKGFHDVEGVATAMRFPPKLFRAVVQDNVTGCIQESDSKRSSFKNSTVFELSYALSKNWTYNHESRRKIEAYRKATTAVAASLVLDIFGTGLLTVGDENIDATTDINSKDTLKNKSADDDREIMIDISHNNEIDETQKASKKRKKVSEENAGEFLTSEKNAKQMNSPDAYVDVVSEKLPKKKRKKLEEAANV